MIIYYYRLLYFLLIHLLKEIEELKTELNQTKEALSKLQSKHQKKKAKLQEVRQTTTETSEKIRFERDSEIRAKNEIFEEFEKMKEGYEEQKKKCEELERGISSFNSKMPGLSMFL